MARSRQRLNEKTVQRTESGFFLGLYMLVLTGLDNHDLMVTRQRARRCPLAKGGAMSPISCDSSRDLALRARRNVLRMLEATPAGHVGGAMSCIDALAVLYASVLTIDPSRPGDPRRDRFLLSAGHKAMAQYAILAECGFFDKSLRDTYGEEDTALGGHPDMHKLPGIEGNTGALGHGLALGVGMGMGLRRQNCDARVFVILGDGELAEGSNWEAAAIAAHYRLGSLTALVDVNGMQISGPTAAVMSMESIPEKFAAFGWRVVEVDGHDHEALHEVLTLPLSEPRPTAIIMRTVKGAGIPTIASRVESHYWKPTPEELDDAIRSLGLDDRTGHDSR